MHSEPSGNVDLDLAVTVLAGGLAWPDRSESVTEWAAATAVLLGVLAVTIDTVLALFSNPYSATARWGLTLAALSAAAIVAVPAVVAVMRDQPSGAWRLPVPAAVFVRLVGIIGVLGLWLAHHRGLELVLAWPFALAAGGDVFLTLQRLGHRVSNRELWAATFGSEIQLGIVVGLLVVVAIGFVEPVQGFQLALGWYGFLVVGLLAIAGLRRIRIAEAELFRRAEDRIVHRERRQRAHWLHDDVASIVAVTKMRMAASGAECRDAERALEDLDHEIRLRQLDEQIEAGATQLAEVIQPYVRHALSLDVEIAEVPGHEDAGVLLDQAAARDARRVIAGAMSNALKAGATTVWIRAIRNGASVALEVEDDAGGFDVDALPIGRGLDRLRTDLGSAFSLERTERGAVVRVMVGIVGDA